jgi:hypothetical protein
MILDLKNVRWGRLVAAAAHAAFAAAWAISAPAQGELNVSPNGEDYRIAGVRVSSIMVATSGWSVACALAAALVLTRSDSTWLLDATDATDSVVAWTATAVAVVAVVHLSDTAAACYVALNAVVVVLAATWVAPAKRKQALLRSAAASGLAHFAAVGAAFYAALQTNRRYAFGAVAVHAAATAAAASASYVFDTARCTPASAPLHFEAALPRYTTSDGSPKNAPSRNQAASCSRESFESEARASAQLTCRLSVAFAFWAEEMRVARRAAGASEASTTLVPPETLEVLAPVACVAFYGIWLLFAYPEKEQKPYYDGPVGSLRGGRADSGGTSGGGHHWGGSSPAAPNAAPEPRSSASRHAMTTPWTSSTTSVHAIAVAASTTAPPQPPAGAGGAGGLGAVTPRISGSGGGAPPRPREQRTGKPKFQHTPAPSFEFTL